jgi:hypothetical protein
MDPISWPPVLCWLALLFCLGAWTGIAFLVRQFLKFNHYRFSFRRSLTPLNRCNDRLRVKCPSRGHPSGIYLKISTAFVSVIGAIVVLMIYHAIVRRRVL